MRLTTLSVFDDIGVDRSILTPNCEVGEMCKFQTLCKSAIVILIWNGFPALATVYNSDGSSTNIQYTHDNLAVDGDTIVLPAGTFTWISGITITKAITLQGQGVGSTIVKDNIQNARIMTWTLRCRPAVAPDWHRISGRRWPSFCSAYRSFSRQWIEYRRFNVSDGSLLLE